MKQWWCLPAISALCRWRQEDQKFKIILGCIEGWRPTWTLPQKTAIIARWWWHTPLFPALGRQRQVDLHEFEASLAYRTSCRTGSKATQRNPALKNKTKAEKL